MSVFSYTKLDAGILKSSVWVGTPSSHKLAWIALLAMKDVLGRVTCSVQGLAREAEITREEAQAALDSFMAPDPDSRTPDLEGRRIEKRDGIYYILNHDKYRDQQDEDYQRQRKARNKAAQRERERAGNAAVSPTNGDCHRLSPHTDADSDADANSKAELLAAAARPASAKNAAPASPAPAGNATASSAAAAASTPQPPSGVASDFTKTFGFSSKAKELIALTAELFGVEQHLDLNPTEVSRLKDIDWGDSVAALKFAASDSYWQQQMRIVEVDEGEEQTSKLPGSEAFKCFIRTYKKALLPQSKKAKKRKIIPEKKASYKAQSCAPTSEGMAAFEVEVN